MQTAGAHHEVGEELLLGGPGDVAVTVLGQGRTLAHCTRRGMPKRTRRVQHVEEEGLDEELEDEAQQVGPPEAACFLPVSS